MNIKLNSRIAISTERAESSYGVPVLVIDGVAYGPDDRFRAELFAAAEEDEGNGSLPVESLLTSLAFEAGGYDGEAHKALRMFYAHRAKAAGLN